MPDTKSEEPVTNVGFALRREAGEIWAVWGDGRAPLKLGKDADVIEAVREFLKTPPA